MNDEPRRGWPDELPPFCPAEIREERDSWWVMVKRARGRWRRLTHFVYKQEAVALAAEEARWRLAAVLDPNTGEVVPINTFGERLP